MAGLVLETNWPFKEMKELSWDFGNIFNIKNAFYIKGENGFSFELKGTAFPYSIFYNE